jgi:hypothetical protein
MFNPMIGLVVFQFEVEIEALQTAKKKKNKNENSDKIEEFTNLVSNLKNSFSSLSALLQCSSAIRYYCCCKIVVAIVISTAAI